MKWPHDRRAERAVLGNSLRSREWHHRARHIVDAADFFYTEHQVIFEALDQLDDLAPHTPATPPTWSDWEAVWPIVPPSSLGVRIAAAWTLGPYGAPLAAIQRLAHHATGTIETDARLVRARADERREIQAIEDRIHELAGTGR